MEVLSSDLKDIALAYMEGLCCPRALTVCIMIRYEQWSELASLTCQPVHYNSSLDYHLAAAATGFFAKFQSAERSSMDRAADEAAFTKWIEAEQLCYRTNSRLDTFLRGGEPAPEERGVCDFFARVRKNIRDILGDSPPVSFDGKFGPGATASDVSGACTVLHKMSSRPTLTSGALFHLVPWTGTAWARAYAKANSLPEGGRLFRDEDLPEIVEGNYYFTVPKKWSIKRTCAKEPSINGYFQLGIGRVMRRRFHRWGIDLDHGKSVHMQVACVASKTDHDSFVTIDLSSASDTVAWKLVKLLLPHSWFELLNSLRSHKTFVSGKGWYVLEKFSSMGNGFTFELESIIFASICAAVMDNPLPGVNLYVLGDDIIVPTSDYVNVRAALEYCGFCLNPEKSFSRGSFRESCGGDYYLGEAVRPFYLKGEPREPQQYIAIANGIRRMALQNDHSSVLWPRLRRSWFKCLDRLPSDIRLCRGPQALGDLCINDDETNWRFRCRSNGIRYVRVYRPAKYRGVQLRRFDPETVLAGALYGMMTIENTSPSSAGARPANEIWDGKRRLALRDGVDGYKLGWVPYS